MARRQEQEGSNEVADALRAASLSHKLRVGAAITSVVVLTLGVFALPSLQKFGSAKLLGDFDLSAGAKRLLTAPSIAEVELPEEPENVEKSQTPREPKSAPKTLVAEDVVEEAELAETTPVAQESAEPQVEETFEDILTTNASTDPAGDALKLLDELDATPTSEETPTVEAQALPTASQVEPSQVEPNAQEAQPAPTPAPEAEEDANAFPEIDLDLAASKRKPRSQRVFARAAELVGPKDPSAKHFAYAANIIGSRSANAFTSFSGPAERVIATETAILASNARANKTPSNMNATRATEPGATQTAVAQVSFTNEERQDGVALADYAEPTSNAKSGVAPKTLGKNANARPQPKTQALDLTAEQIAQDERRNAAARQALRKAGVQGAHVERWDANSYRATGVSRNADGKASLEEAFGATAEEAAKALLAKTRRN